MDPHCCRLSVLFTFLYVSEMSANVPREKILFESSLIYAKF